MVGPQFFNLFDQYKDFITNLGKKLHTQAETNLSKILMSIGFQGTPVSEINCPIGRTDMIFFINSINHSIHFEIFRSKSQVPQDLRLLEQSHYDKQIAIIIDPKIDESVIDEYYHKNPSTKFEVFYLSEFFIENKLDETREKLIKIINRISAGSQSPRRNVKELLEAVVNDYRINCKDNKFYGFKDPIKEMMRVKRIAEYMNKDAVKLDMERFIQRYTDAIAHERSKREEIEKKKPKGLRIIFNNRYLSQEIQNNFVDYFDRFLHSIKSYLNM